MSSGSDAAGLAALSICESILLSLTQNAIIDQAEGQAILTDAATAHRGAAPLSDGDARKHEQVAVLIEAIRDGGNSVRRTRHASTVGGDGSDEQGIS